jgi:hypothetical protein
MSLGMVSETTWKFFFPGSFSPFNTGVPDGDR